MDPSTIAAFLRSGNAQKQIAAIIALTQQYLASPSLPTSDVLSAVIENGLNSENNELREKSFRFIFVLYDQKRSVRWNEIRSAVSTELSTAECSRCLSAAVAVLTSVEEFELLSFCCSKEGTSIIKSCCLLPDNELRRTAIIGLGV